MTCAEFKENVAAFALGALNEEERRACEEHLAAREAHEGCEEELRQAFETTALIGASIPPGSPGEHVWQAIEREVGREARGSAPERRASRSRPAPATRPASHPTTQRPSKARERAAWGLSAIAAAAAVAIFFAWRAEQAERTEIEDELAQAQIARGSAEERLAAIENDLGDRIQNADTQRRACLEELESARVSLKDKERALELLGAPRTLLIQLAAQGNVPYRASALWNQEKAQAILLSSALEPKAGKDYELWLIRGDKKIPAGLLEVAAGQPTIARIDPALLRDGRPDALAVTIEPAGGVPQPTGPIVLLGKLT